MDITRDAVEEWLLKHHRDRKWLADRCGVTEVNVGHWMNKKGKARPIPAEHQITIRKLMDEDAAREEVKPLHNLVLEFEDVDYEPVEKAAVRNGVSIREWAKRILNEAATMTDEEFFRVVTGGNVVEMPTRPHLEAAAGSPIGAEVQEWEGADDTVLVRINGLSMVPLFNDGEVIAMRHKRAARSKFMKKGLIYLVEYDGGYTVKEYNTRLATPEEIADGISYISEEDGQPKVRILKSRNPEYPEIVIKTDAEWIAWFEPKKA